MNAIEKSIQRKKKRTEKVSSSRKFVARLRAEGIKKEMGRKKAEAYATTSDPNHDGRIWMFP